VDKGPLHKMRMDLQDVDLQEVVCGLLLAGTMLMVENEYDDHHTEAEERRLTLRQPAELSKLALVCKAWHKALQKHRQQQIDAAVEFCIHAAPIFAIDIVNIDRYPQHTTMPEVSELELQVLLGSRLKFAMHMMRVGAPPKLTITCVVPQRSDGGHWYSGPHSVTVHKLCWKPEDDYEPEDSAEYTAWCDATIVHVHAWCKAQYALMTAAQAIE
jgi:hypothetical protein